MMDERPLTLVVDPDVDTLTFLYSILDTKGYRVATSSSGIDALKFVSRRKPDLVLGAVCLPDLSGRSFSEEIKRASPDTRVVFLVGKDEWVFFGDALKTGGDDFVLKPLIRGEILLTVDRMLDPVRQ